jgi:hypothetical protein
MTFFKKSVVPLMFILFPLCLSAQISMSSKAVKTGNSYVQPSTTTSSAVTPSAIKTASVPSAAPGITDHVDAQVLNSTDDQSEVHLSVNRYNPSILTCSFNTYVTSISTYSQSHFVSSNAGASWTGSDIFDPNSPLVGGDPSTTFDANGNIYISTIKNSGYYIIKSTNNSTFASPVFAGGQSDFDKEMIAADNQSSSPYKNNLYAAWSEFTDIGSGTKPIVRFNRSTDGGVTFSPLLTLKNGPGQGTNVQTGPNGEVYVCYADYGAGPVATFPAVGFGFVKSLNGGTSFSAPQVAVAYTGIRKLYTVNNRLTFEDPNFNKIRVNDYPSMAVDKSGSVKNGRVYVVFAAQQNGNGKAVIELSYSDNQGTSWSVPKIVSIGNGIQSFFPWVTVDQATGGLYIAYYAIDGAGFQTNTYVAISNDGGNTFVNQLVSDVSHVTAPINNIRYSPGYAGDYIGVAAHGGKAYVSWMDQRTATWQVYVSQVDNLPAITGATTAFCTSATYTASNVPAGQTVAWSASPLGVVSLSPSGNQVTATKLSQGYFTLTATLNPSNVSSSIGLSTQPTVSNITYYTTGSCSSDGYINWYLSATPNMPTATNWQWTVSYLGTNSAIIIDNPNAQTINAKVLGGGQVTVTYKDGCGETSAQNGVTLYSNCPRLSAIVAYPNPASSQLTIENKPVRHDAAGPGALVVTDNSVSDFTAELYNSKGVIIRKAKNPTNSTAIVFNTADITNGTYYLHVKQGSDVIEKQIIVQH